MRIIWHSNAPWAGTGYGVQTKIATEQLKNLGHEIIISAFYGIQGATINAPGGFLVLPSGHSDTYGNDLIRAHYRFMNADLVISLIDAWVLEPKYFGTFPWAAWTPVDHDPVPRHVTHSLIEGQAVPIAMSRFGERALRDAGLDPLYVPHSLDPVFLEDIPSRDDIRKGYGWDDRFVVGMVAANKGKAPSRKSFAQVFQAYARFLETHPGANSLLYLHTERDPAYGVDLIDMAERFELPKESFAFVDPYKHMMGISPSTMRNTYAAMDVLANPAMGEGFGVPIIEAQAAGTPVIVSDWTAMPELCHSGVKVGGTKFFTNQSSFQIIPSVDEIYEGLRWAYWTDHDRKETREWALDSYAPEIVTEKYWVPALDEIVDRTKDRDFGEID